MAGDRHYDLDPAFSTRSSERRVATPLNIGMFSVHFQVSDTLVACTAIAESGCIVNIIGDAHCALLKGCQ